MPTEITWVPEGSASGSRRKDAAQSEPPPEHQLVSTNVPSTARDSDSGASPAAASAEPVAVTSMVPSANDPSIGEVIVTVGRVAAVAVTEVSGDATRTQPARNEVRRATRTRCP